MTPNKAAKPTSKRKPARTANKKPQSKPSVAAEQKLTQRESELSILNSMGEAMSKSLDVKTVTRIVGDKVRDIFKAEVTEILLLDPATKTIHAPYSYYRGYQEIEPFAFGDGITSTIIKKRKPVKINTLKDGLKLGTLVFSEEDKTESYMGVPIIAADRPVGVLSIQSYKKHAFNEPDLQLLETLASNMGVAIQNARLFEETEQRNAELAIINSIQEGLASKLEFQAIIDLIGDKVYEIFNSQATVISLYDPAGKRISHRYIKERGERMYVSGSQPIDKFRQRVVKTRQAFLINRDYLKIAKEMEEPTTLEGEEPKSLLFVPMMVAGEVKGVISLQSIDRENAFSESDVSLLTTLANSMSVALENARLFEETEQRNAELAIINSVQEGLASKLDLQAIYDLVGDKIRGIFDAQVVDIGLYNKADKMIHFPYTIERGKRFPDEPIQVVGFRKQAMKTRQPLLITENIMQAAAEYGNPLSAIQGEVPKSVLYVPMVVNGESKGVISLQNLDREHAFSESDAKLLTTLVNAMSVALDNARLLEETQQRAAELAIINSVQEGLASKLDMQAIYDLIGDKIRDIFDAQVVDIGLYDSKDGLLHFPYTIERGVRFPNEPMQIIGYRKHVLRTRQPLLIKQNSPQLSEQYGNPYAIQGEPAKSILYVPMIVGGETKGVISLQNLDRENAFDESDVSLLATLANAMSVALENARLFDETQQRNAELAIINSVQEGLASKLEMQAIYDLIGNKIRDIFDAQVVDIGLYNPSDRLIHFPYTIERGARFPDEPIKLIGFRLHVMETKKPLLINQDTAGASERYGNPVSIQGEAPKSEVFVPMIVGDEAVGVISLQNLDRENAFSESDVNVLTTLVNSMSVALENARLFDETQRLLKVTEDRAAELAIINSVQHALAAELNIQGIYDAVGDKIREIFHKTDMSIRIYDPQTNLVHYPYTYENGARISIDSSPLGDKGFESHIIKSHTPLVINENMTAEMEKYGAYTIPGTDRAKASVYVPLIVGEQVRGLINLDSYEKENAFSESDVRLLQTLANAMSVALENARLFDETQRLLKITEDRAAELAIINSVQAGLASKLDMQSIYDLVGDKVRDIFNSEVVYIAVRKAENPNLIDFPYYLDRGKRLHIPSNKLGEGITSRIINSNQHIIAHTMQEQLDLGGIYEEGEESKSYIGIPIRLGNFVAGVVSVQSYKEHAFNESDVRLLQTLASSMGVALENARLFDETQRLLKITEDRAAELAIINSVQEQLAAKLDIDSIYELVGEKLRELFETHAISLVSFDHEKKTYHYHYLLEKGNRITVADAPITPMGWHIINTRQTFLVNENVVENLAAVGIQLNIIPGTEPTKTLLRAPILINDQVFGFIGLSNLDHENAFSDSDVHLLQTLASSLSVALESARLFDETKRNAAELATVNTISSALASELDLSALIQLVGEQIRMTFRADIAYVALLDESGEKINFPYTFGEEQTPMAAGEGLTGRIIETGKPILLNEVVDEKIEEIGATNVGVMTLSYLGVPIMVGNRAVGVVSVQSATQERAFNENHEHLLTTIATNVGTALHNAQLYKEAQELRAAAESANHAKSAFMANMSHELRTPLNAIIGFTRIVRKKSDGLLPEKQIENLDKVLSSGEHLLGLINTVLDIAKIEAGRMDVAASNFKVASLIDQAASIAAPLLKPVVRLEKLVDERLDIMVSDLDKIKQIILNLLSNAAKFTHHGKIVLRAEQTLVESVPHACISVTDSGIGISEEALGRVFEEFQQADSTTTRQYGGTGLGLAISRNLARLLGGDLTATSELGKGSTFTLTLPLQFGKTTASPLVPQFASILNSKSILKKDTSKTRVLVIDDDPDAVYLLQESLNPKEFEVAGARNGADGLQVARSQKPDAILLDILMPEADGWQVLHDLKEDPATTNIPVILLTIVDKKALGFRLGADAYLLKPLNPPVVMETLRKVIGSHAHSHKRVLVVDDDPHVADMLHQILPENEYVLDSAPDGEAGLGAVEAERPDVILLDLMMPKLDGFGVIERLRMNADWRSIPVIVISAKELTQAEAKMLKETVTHVMKKQGFDSTELLQEIHHALGV